ncbi:cache domain-containing protein [Limisalsivibrio acetivorans]|uniref:cache domain-containing protein n=1 Tax=Limisalsivibrio acetivorans TaxID=1304888 RepID=UPI0003B585DE|nr:cache domain-containing protein [Limisalsivibrio acetivorans]
MDREGEDRKIAALSFLSLISVVAIFAVTISFIFISSNIREIKRKSQQLQNQIYDVRRDVLSGRLASETRRITYASEEMKSRTESELLERVHNAYSVIYRTYRDMAGEYPDAKIIETAASLLDKMRFNNGNGYYFLIDMKGLSHLFPTNREMEGTNIIGLQDSNGVFIVQKMLEIAKNRREDFLEWSWYKPDNYLLMYEKKGYIKYVEALDLFVGTGLYKEDIINESKNVILNEMQRLSRLNPKEERLSIYEITETADGDRFIETLLEKGDRYTEKPTPGYTANILERIKEENQVCISNSLYREQEGYAVPALSCFRLIEDWNWIISRTMSTRDISDLVMREEHLLREGLKRNIYILAGAVLSALLIGVVISFVIASNISSIFRRYGKINKNQTDKLAAANQRLHEKIKERKEVEEQLVRARAELERKVQDRTLELKRKNEFLIAENIERKQAEKALIKAKEEAETANFAKSEFLTNMSQELRSPMHEILSFSRFGIDKHSKVPPEKVQRYFSQIKDSGEKLLGFLNSLLELSKLEAGKMEYRINVTDARSAAEQSVKELELNLSEKGLVVTITPEGIQQPVYADVGAILQVFRHLLSSLIRVAENNSEISIAFAPSRLQRKGEDVKALAAEIRLTENILTDKEVSELFSGYADKPKPDGSNTFGLGLSICREIILVHDGDVFAAREGAETVIRFILKSPEEVKGDSLNE